MKLIINIDDNLYTRLFDVGVDNYDDAVDMAKAIRKGTPFEQIRNEIAELHSDMNVINYNLAVGNVLDIIDKY